MFGIITLYVKKALTRVYIVIYSSLAMKKQYLATSNFGGHLDYYSHYYNE